MRCSVDRDYPVDRVIHLLNNWGQVREFHFRKKGALKNNHFAMP